MFEALVASLGQVSLLRHEDSGDVLAEEDVIPPDFHLVLKNGSRLLVEVKNFYQGGNAFRKFSLRTAEVERRQRYASYLGCPLFIAVYWVTWGRWTLFWPDVLTQDGNTSTVSVFNAFSADRMAELGDLMIGTTPPLTVRISTDERHDRHIDPSGEVVVKIRDVRLYCAGRELVDDGERRIATYIMLHGNWMEHESVDIHDHELRSIEYSYWPMEQAGQGFDIVGNLSEMFSRYYLFASTSEDDQVVQTLEPYSPGSSDS